MRRRLSSIAIGFALLALAAPGLGAEKRTRPADEEPHLIGVVNFYYPRLMYLKYQPLVDYLSEQTGHRWDLRISTTYQQTVDELCSGRLTMAYLGPLTYVRAHAACGAEPLVRLQTAGLATYRSLILVREDGPYRRLSDLAGSRFAFGSALSTSSHLVPRGMLEKAGLDLTTDLEISYLEHHERAARAVLLGEVEACGVRDIVGQKFVGRGLRVLAESDPIPNFPFVLGPRAADAMKRELIRVLIELPKENPSISETMASWDKEIARGFVPCTDAEYDGVRRLARQVLGPDALTLPEVELRRAGAGR